MIMSIQRLFQIICFILSLHGELTSTTEANIRSKRSASKTVDIAMFTDRSPPGKKFSVYVDDTMTRLHIEVTVDRSNPVIIVAKPSGPGPFPKLNGTASTGTVTATIDVALTVADYGIWHLTKLDANTWNVKVQGESHLDFTYQFLEGGMIQMPITGGPIQGETYITRISVPEYAIIQTVDTILEFVIEKSSPANMIPLKVIGNGTYEAASIKMLDKDFMIGIQGRDKSGNFLRRITVIKPVAWILSVPTFSAGVKWYENTKLDIPFFVINKMKADQDIDIKIQDTQGLAEAPKVISTTLTPGQNYSNHFVLTGRRFGVTTEVTITLSQYLGHGQIKQGPSAVKQFTVNRNQTSTSTSTTTIAPTTITFTTNRVSSSGSTLSTGVKSSSSSIAGIATSSTTSFNRIKSVSTRTVAGYTSITSPYASLKSGHPVSIARTTSSFESPTNTKAIHSTATAATTTASTISSSHQSFISSSMRKQSPTISVTSYPSAQTTSAKVNTDENNKGDFFAIISAIVIKSGMKRGHPSSELKKKYMTFSEHIDIAWP